MSKNSAVTLVSGVREVLTPDHGTTIVSYKTSDGRGWGSLKMANGYQRYLNRNSKVDATLVAVLKRAGVSPFPSNPNVIPRGLLVEVLTSVEALTELLAAANSRGLRAA